jgi:hypothetical protein
MKLIDKPFDGNKCNMRDFVDNASAAFELIIRDQHGVLLKFVKMKITGEYDSK